VRWSCRPCARQQRTRTWRCAGGSSRHKRVHVEDADGRRLTPNGTSTSSHSGSNGSYAEIGLSFPKAMIGKGEGARLVIEDWLITRHSVPFAWQDMPLP
jgi:hypothetical protein